MKSNLMSVGFWLSVAIVGLVVAVAYKVIVQPLLPASVTKYTPSV